MKLTLSALSLFFLAACSTSSGPATQGGATGASSGAQGSGASGAASSGSAGSTAASGTSGTVAAAGSTSGVASGATAGAAGNTASGASTGFAGSGSGSGVQASGSVTSGTSGSPSSGASSGAPSSGASGSSSLDGGQPVDSGPLALPDGSINSVPAGYKGTPYNGMKAQIPGTVYARNYDLGGPGVGYNHPGAINCGDWPGGMPMYRADCVGLSVENKQKPDVTVDGGPANYGEIYVSYCAQGEWLNYTLDVLQSGTYSVALNVGAPGGLSVQFDFSSVPVASTGKLAIPASVDQAQPGHEMYHVWANVTTPGMVTLPAGTYVMKFTIVTAQANFDTFTFTKM
jgi:hypothetical protein